MIPQDALSRLRDPFDRKEIDKLPRGIDKTRPKAKCKVCGGYHEPASVHLDYVGHGRVTARLLDVDPTWTWEPFATDEHGLPAMTHNDKGQPIGLWIRLTVCGVTRIGFGDLPAAKGADGIKEAIGDAIRNAAMRFGVALDLWVKGDAPATKEQADADGAEAPETQTLAQTARARLMTHFQGDIAAAQTFVISLFGEDWPGRLEKLSAKDQQRLIGAIDAEKSEPATEPQANEPEPEQPAPDAGQSDLGWPVETIGEAELGELRAMIERLELDEAGICKTAKVKDLTELSTEQAVGIMKKLRGIEEQRAKAGS